MSMDIGQPPVDAVVVKAELLVIEPETVQSGGVEVEPPPSDADR